MDPRSRLVSTCQAEAKAYGYTLTIWGGGALLIHAFGTPSPPDVFAYVFGALFGFALLVGYAFDSPLSSGGRDDDQRDGDFLAASTIHFLATPGNLLLAYATILLLAGTGIPHWAAYFAVGTEATLAYNVLTLLEDYIGELLSVPRFQRG
ncbi:hypothetical protein ACFQE1_07750 [Halobium palmae]|uniref:Uncharacterized protein n=1 Tax=Halobium palmae TaxID=1776492 RepID=A0ABD5RXZ4_9EURY